MSEYKQLLFEEGKRLQGQGLGVVVVNLKDKSPCYIRGIQEHGYCQPLMNSEELSIALDAVPDEGVGIALCTTGNNLICVDMDTKNGKQGDKTLLRLGDELGRLPPGRYMEISQSGGSHFWYRLPEGHGLRKYIDYDGVDFLCGNSMAVIAPSEKYYQNSPKPLEYDELPLLPDAWIEFVRNLNEDKNMTEDNDEVLLDTSIYEKTLVLYEVGPLSWTKVGVML